MKYGSIETIQSSIAKHLSSISVAKCGISSFIFLYLLNLQLDNAAKICIFFKKKVMGEGIK